MPSIFGYWNLQGRAEPIRLLLNYVEEEFEDKYYKLGPAPDFSRDSWLKEKFTLGFDFPNLPYYNDGQVKLTQSNCILRYLGRKYNCGGKTDTEKSRVELALDQVYDDRMAMGRICYNPEFNKLKEDFIKQMPPKLKLYETFLGDYPYVAGQEVTVADFTLYAMLKEHTMLEPNCLDDFPRLRTFVNSIENLPQIKRYRQSESYPKLPLYSRFANFGTTQGY